MKKKFVYMELMMASLSDAFLLHPSLPFLLLVLLTFSLQGWREGRKKLFPFLTKVPKVNHSIYKPGIFALLNAQLQLQKFKFFSPATGCELFWNKWLKRLLSLLFPNALTRLFTHDRQYPILLTVRVLMHFSTMKRA